MRYMICKYFLPYLTFSFCWWFLFLCRSFQFDVDALVDFCFCCLWFFVSYQKTSLQRSMSRNFFPRFSSWSLTVLCLVQVFNSFQVNFHGWYKNRGLISFICVWLSSLPNTIYQRNYPYPLVILGSLVN